jgi:hypothetical protein
MEVSLMQGEHRTYTRFDVVSLGFEAHCVDAEGTRYLWHDDHGLRVDARGLRTTLITGFAQLPEGPWTPTKLGERELLEGELWR